MGDSFFFLDFVYILFWYFFLPCSFPAMEPYGGDCLEVIFCLWILLPNKELRTQNDETEKHIQIQTKQEITKNAVKQTGTER